KEIAEGKGQHVASRKEGLLRITIDHRPEKRAEHEEHSEHAYDNGGVGEENNLDEDEDEPDDKEGDHFPAGQPGQVMAKKEEGKADGRDNSGQARSGNL